MSKSFRVAKGCGPQRRGILAACFFLFFLILSFSPALRSGDFNYTDYIVATISTHSPKGIREKIVLQSEIERAMDSRFRGNDKSGGNDNVRGNDDEEIKKAFSRIVLATLLDFKAEDLRFYRHVPAYRVEYVKQVIFSQDSRLRGNDNRKNRVSLYEEMKKNVPWHFRITWDEKIPDNLIDPAMRDHPWPAMEMKWSSLPPTLWAFEEGLRKNVDRVYHSITRRKVVEKILQQEFGLTESWVAPPLEMAAFYEAHQQIFPKELSRATIVEATLPRDKTADAVTLFRELEAIFWEKFEMDSRFRGNDKKGGNDKGEGNEIQKVRKDFSSEFVAKLASAEFLEHEVDFTTQHEKPGLYAFSVSQGTETTFIPMYEFIDNDGKYHLWLLKEKGIVFEDDATQKFIRNQLFSRERQRAFVKWVQERLEKTMIRFSDRVLNDSNHPLSTFQVTDVEEEILRPFATCGLGPQDDMDDMLEKIFEIEFICN